MSQYFLAGATLLFATYTLGYISAVAKFINKRNVEYFKQLFIIFFVGKLIYLFPIVLKALYEPPGFVTVLIDFADISAEVCLYGYLLFFLNSFFGMVTFQRVLIIAGLYSLGWVFDILESVDRHILNGGLHFFIANISALPLLVYIVYIQLKQLHNITDKLLRQLLGYSIIIVGSISAVTLIDGFLESVVGINLPKDALHVFVYCLVSLLYLNSIRDFFSTRDESDISRYLEQFQLTSRESEIIGYLIEGHSYKSIAYELSISLATVKTHIHNIYSKTGQESRFTLLNSIQTFNRS